MTAASRPVSLIQFSVSEPPRQSLSTSSSGNHSLPLRRSTSPTNRGHYTLRRFSYLPDISSDNDFSPARPRSIIRSASFSAMAQRFMEKSTEKEKNHSEMVPLPDYSSPSASSTTAHPKATDQQTTSQRFFSRHRPYKYPKKKRSLASLLETSAAETQGSSSVSSATIRTNLPDSATSLSILPSMSAIKRPGKHSADHDIWNELGQLGVINSTSPNNKDTIWAKRHNMKVHTERKAVYMQAYNPVVLENDRHFDLLLRRLNLTENPTFSDYGRNHPNNVLDLGCGSGHWLVEAAKHWTRNTTFTGFDMVNVLIPEARGSIHFIPGNFLQFPWPFPNKSFDLVRMANLSLCIPYDKWEAVLAEVHRVLAVDGRLELIDDQINFPYAPPLKSETSSAPSINVSATNGAPTSAHSKGTSFFDDFDDHDDDNDSINTESTLVSDKGISPSAKDTCGHSLLRSDGDSRSDQLLPALSSDASNSPISAATIKPFDINQPSEWSTDVTTCLELENVFQQMLHKKYGIHSCPSEFLLDVMRHVFGNGEKVKSYRLQLAPKDAEKEFDFYDGRANTTGGLESSEKEEKVVPELKTVGRMLNGITKSWSRGSASSSMTDLPQLNPDGATSKATRRWEEFPEYISQVPEKLSVKAAVRLGIPVNGERKSEEPSRSPSPSPPTSDNVHSPPISARKSQDSTTSDSSVESRLSAKAANRLGISYSALSEAAASAQASTRRPQSSQLTLIDHLPFQSPGLIVWPNKFIPLSPAELEMHACKNIHTLIGCKPALAEFVGSFLDEEGKKIESDEEFDQALWDYECFRRRRFNWPSEIPNWDSDVYSDTPGSLPKTIDASRLSNARNSLNLDLFTTPTPEVIGANSPQNVDKRPNLTDVRTIRVYEAIKIGEYSLSTLQHPRAAPPSPTRYL